MSIFSAAIAMVVPLVRVDVACRPSLPRLGRCPIGQRRQRGPTASTGGPAAARRVRPARHPGARAGRGVAAQLGGEPVVAALGPAARALVRQRGAAAPHVLADRRARQPPTSRDAARRDRRGHRGVHPPLRRRGARLGSGRGPAVPAGRAGGAHRAAGIRVDRPVGGGGRGAAPGARGERLADADLAASRHARGPRRPSRAWPASPTGGPTRATTCSSTSSPTCSPTAPCSP